MTKQEIDAIKEFVRAVGEEAHNEVYNLDGYDSAVTRRMMAEDKLDSLAEDKS